MVPDSLKQIWDYIWSYLQATPAPGLQPHQSDGYHILWSSIFKSDAWLRKMIQMKGNPFLFGPELDKVGLSTENRNRIYMTIHCGEQTTCSDYDFRLFRKSLQPHEYDKSKKEIMFHAGIVLNVSEIECPEDPLELDDEWLTRLVSKGGRHAVSQFSFYEGNRISTLLPSHIIAVGGPPYTAAILQYGYAITVPYGRKTSHVVFESHQKRNAVKFDYDGSGRVYSMRIRQ